VLVVDDQSPVRNVLVRLLEEAGCTVLGAAADGAEAVTLALELRPDAVLMDVRMPKLDGIQATAQIREQLPDARVVLLSAYEDPALQQDAEAAGAHAYLIKGCAAEDLLHALRG
jgi:DNA-binding NarL/FixJ family response regulator